MLADMFPGVLVAIVLASAGAALVERTSSEHRDFRHSELVGLAVYRLIGWYQNEAVKRHGNSREPNRNSRRARRRCLWSTTSPPRLLYVWLCVALGYFTVSMCSDVTFTLATVFSIVPLFSLVWIDQQLLYSDPSQHPARPSNCNPDFRVLPPSSFRLSSTPIIRHASSARISSSYIQSHEYLSTHTRRFSSRSFSSSSTCLSARVISRRLSILDASSPVAIPAQHLHQAASDSLSQTSSGFLLFLDNPVSLIYAYIPSSFFPSLLYVAIY
ncbi:hypothetical protein R3P38DRAFT_3172234 [Favolaschia claudopus]|uniref:Uncharacterized protein n=1 Tax=Favolaschia claudopus TaxID=2862362 RepID=A0AAW0DJC5_9AGAR